MLALTSDIRTPLHRWPAWLKLVLMSAAIVTLFLLDSVVFLGTATALTVLLYTAFGKKFAVLGLRMLKPLRTFLIFILLWQIIIGAPVVGVAIVLRLATAVALANLVTLTTRLDDMIDVVFRLTRPLARLGLSPVALSLAIAMVIRFVPVLLDRANRMSDAFRARSMKRPTFRIVLPLLISVLDDAEHVATALRARGGLDGAYQP